MRRLLTRSAFALSLAVPLLVAPSGCKNKSTIPGTEIPDTPDTREILQVLERYRMAVSRKDAAAVLSTAHDSYFDTAGTDDPSDDLEYSELAPLLRRRLSQLESVRFTVDYLEIHVDRDRAVARVWMDASFRMKPLLDSEGNPRTPPRYTRKQDYAEFQLVRMGETWQIVSGL